MKRAFFVVFILLVAAVFIAGCSPTKPNGGVTPEPDTWKTIASVDDSDMYKNLIKGVMGSLADISDRKVNTSNPIFSVDTKMKLEFNDYFLWFVFKLNYKLNDPNALKFTAEILNEDEDEVLVGAYFMNDFLYLKLMDGSAGMMKFPIENQVVSKLLPISLKDTDVTNTAIAMSAAISINGDISGKTRLNGTVPEFKYSFNINLPATLQNIVGSLDLDNIPGIDTDTLSLIIQRVLGVSLDDIRDGRLPDSSVTVSFGTSGEKLSNFKLDLSVEQGGSSQNSLFGGGDIDFSVNLEKLLIKKEFTSLPFFTKKIENNEGVLVDEYTTYQNYLEQTFGLRFNMIQKGVSSAEDIPFGIKAEVQLDLDEINNNKVLIELLNEEEDPVTGIYFNDGILYLYSTKEDGYQKRASLELDVIGLYNHIKDGVEIENPTPNEKKEAIEYVAFVIGALRIGKDRIAFCINEDFYEVLLPGFADAVAYGDALLPEDIDLAEILFDAFNIDPIEYIMSNVYEFYIDFSEDAENFIYAVEGDISFPEDLLDGSDDE